MRVLRYGTHNRSGSRLAMVGDPTGMKLEIVENPEAKEARFLHVAFRASDVDASLTALAEKGWEAMGGAKDLASAHARTGRVVGPDGFELQMITYQPSSPDIVEWK